MLLIIDVQDTLALTVNEALAKWAHRPGTAWGPGGHAMRTIGAAKRRACAKLAKCGLTPAQVDASIKDALDMAELLRLAEDE